MHKTFLALQYFAKSLAIKSQLLNSDIIHIYTSWTAIARLITSYLYARMLLVINANSNKTRPDVLTVLLEYIDLFNLLGRRQNVATVCCCLLFALHVVICSSCCYL